MSNFFCDFSISTIFFLALSYKTIELIYHIYIYIYIYTNIYHIDYKPKHIFYRMVLDIINMCAFWRLCKSFHFKVGCIFIRMASLDHWMKNIVEVIGHNKLHHLICIHLVRHSKLSTKKQLSLLSYAYTKYYY